MDARPNKTQGRLAERDVVVLRSAIATRAADVVTVEEPLEIRIRGESVAVVMRTPKDDFDLVAGFLLTEGIIDGPQHLGILSYCATAEPPNEENIVEVQLTDDASFDLEQLKRNFYASSSCGVCGKASIEQVTAQASPVDADFEIDVDTLYKLNDGLRKAQEVFEKTGSLHAAGLFDVSGRLLSLREDVGRHNAVDKVVGNFILDGRLPPDRSVLMVSGRASYEIMQKALMAGIPIVAAVSAPSSLAVDLAMEANMTLVGFLRGVGCNVYAGAQRIAYSQ